MDLPERFQSREQVTEYIRTEVGSLKEKGHLYASLLKELGSKRARALQPIPELGAVRNYLVNKNRAIVVFEATGKNEQRPGKLYMKRIGNRWFVLWRTG